MKLNTKSTAGFLAAPDKSCHACLVYGPDSGLVQEHGKAIRTKILGEKPDEFAFIEMDGQRLQEDPSLLADELRTVYMLADKRLIFIRDASDKLLPAIENSLEHWHGGVFLLLAAGELPPRSSLRAWFEKAGNAAALPCYHDDVRSLRQLIQQTFTQWAIRADAETIDYLVQQLGNDRRVTLNELEKICLFAGKQGQLDVESARQLVDYNRESQFDDMAASLADRNLAALEKELQLAAQEQLSPVSYLRALQRYFNRLYYVRSLVDGGQPLDEAIQELKPPVFFKELPRFTRHAGQWDTASLAMALQRLVQAERACKTSDLPPYPASSRALFQATQARKAG